MVATTDGARGAIAARSVRNRRDFLSGTVRATLLGLAASLGLRAAARAEAQHAPTPQPRNGVERRVRLFLCGDVMSGRGIDQVQARPGDPRLYEPYVRSALRYVEIAEQASGAIPRQVPPAYIWGEALAELDRARPDARIVNLETAVTSRGDPWPGKGIHYRMHPGNVACLAAARIDCCVLANNHVLDWGRDGLLETLAVLHGAGLRTAGAGRVAVEAVAPAVIDLPRGGRVLVFACGSPTSGVPAEWAAASRRPGLWVLDEDDRGAVEQVARAVSIARRPGDVVVVSIHWGGNWGYEVPAAQRAMAHRLIEDAGVDLVHGHSSHHPRPAEVHRGKLILYGCGDFLNDYEGIGGYEAFRPELTLMYLPELDVATGRLLRLRLEPLHMRRFRLERATEEDARWMCDHLNVAAQDFGTRLALRSDGTIEVEWT